MLPSPGLSCPRTEVGGICMLGLKEFGGGGSRSMKLKARLEHKELRSCLGSIVGCLAISSSFPARPSSLWVEVSRRASHRAGRLVAEKPPQDARSGLRDC